MLTRVRVVVVAAVGLAACVSNPRSMADWSAGEPVAAAQIVHWTGGDSESEAPVFRPLLAGRDFEDAWLDVVIRLGSARFPTTMLRPEVDFTNCVGFAIAAGTTWNSNGYALRSVDRVDGESHVRLDQLTFQSMGAGERTRPFGIFLLTRVPGETVVVDENVADLIGAPPKWKERGRFTVPRSLAAPAPGK